MCNLTAMDWNRSKNEIINFVQHRPQLCCNVKKPITLTLGRLDLENDDNFCGEPFGPEASFGNVLSPCSRNFSFSLCVNS